MVEVNRLLVAALCTWRLTHLLHAEDGPWNFGLRLRRAAGEGLFGRLLDCFQCLSLWIALPLAWAIRRDLLDLALLWPALSGAAILLERVTAAREQAATPPAQFTEDP